MGESSTDKTRSRRSRRVAEAPPHGQAAALLSARKDRRCSLPRDPYYRSRVCLAASEASGLWNCRRLSVLVPRPV